MSSIRLATAANVRAFQTLSQGLDKSDNKWADSIDNGALEDETGRFRVWSGNLGALQKGHSSLDYRLRDSPLLSSNALKFLKELEQNLNEANAVVSGERLPYEQQAKAIETQNEDDDDDDFFDDDEDEDEDDESSKSMRTELSMRFAEIVDIIDNLYKLSVRIRTPTIRSRSLKAATYHPKDPETGVDLLSAYAEYDVQHIKELLEELRREQANKTEAGAGAGKDDDSSFDYLIMRLSAAITSRRRQFKYWKRHRDKLGVSTILEDKLPTIEPQSRPEPQRNDTLDALPELPALTTPKEAQSQRTGRTMLSGTEATQHHQSLDEIVDTKSVTSYAVTVKDIHGKGIELPPPPKAADGERDFECPYCYIICPARYGRGRAWKTHLLQDLQPYICTYPECESAEQLFRSRREWAAHEATHRKAWRCPEHPTAIFKTQGGLQDHLQREHADSFPESQLPAIVKVGETSTVDTRPKCPICLAPSDFEGLGDFHNHIANHLERIATFALPTGTEDDDDGGSSVASRGRSDSMDSRNVDDLSLPTDESISVDNEVKESKSLVEPPATDVVSSDPDVQPNVDQRSLLSMANLDQIPDGTQGRIDTLFTSVPEPAVTGEVDGEKFEISRTDTSTDQETQRRGNLTAYLQSLPGFASITYSTPPGSGIWTGKAVFESETMATNALSVFDEKLFPLIRIQQNETSKEMISIMSIKGHPNLEMSENQQSLDDSEVLEGSVYGSVDPNFYIPNEDAKKEPVITMSDIPTLRSMYRSRLLLQRDQSFLPNDSYNQVISFCHYDLTKIKVDAIVNSANKQLRPTSGDTLNNAIFRAAGPDLAAETKSYPKLGSEAVLTPGYRLPCANIIHVLRPGYHNYPNTTGQFNQLKDCYRNALRAAVKNNLKSIAFPCLGTGGVGVPPKVAARIALQEVREYLDAPPEYKFERIIFCVNSAIDENAYVSLLPAYFPPTFDDVDIARSSVWLQDRGSLSVKVLEARTQVQKVFRELDIRLSKTVPGFPREIMTELVAIDICLASIRKHLLWKQDASGSMSDLKLACSVMMSVCGNMTETIDLARDLDNAASRTDESIWDDFNSDWRARHGTDVAGFLQSCRDLIECLDDMITRNGREIAELEQIRAKLETYKSRRREPGGKGVDNRLSAFDEVLYLREYQREAVESSSVGEIVKLSQVQSVSQLYKLGELEERNTLAHPSAIFNHTVCLVRENITKLQVDILVNSTDVYFASMGTLDRSVFSKAGPEMNAAISAYAGKCTEGDVKVTPGYALPAKSVLHVIPPRQYRKDTKRILREIYRQILHTAVSMRATSIAIPSIGTGMLNYPRNDTVCLALEEIKRFLEIAEPSSLLEKIILVVYSSNDEHVYKNWIPVYFPPIDINVNRALPASQPIPAEDPGSSGPPRRKLYDSVGEAFRSVRFDQPAVPWRRINPVEEGTLINFESHADSCDTCKDPKRVYLEDQELCERGYSLAQKILKHMNMREDHKVYSKPDDRGRVHELEVPGEQFPVSTKLLDAVERSFRDGKHDQPFVSPNRLYKHGNQQNKEASPVADNNTASVMKEFEAFRVHVSINYDTESATIISSKLLMIRVYGDHVKVIDPTMPSEGQPQRLSFSFYTSTKLTRHKTTPEIIVRNPNILQSVSEVQGSSILLRCTSDMSCSLLLRKLRDVKRRTVGEEESEDSEGPKNAEDSEDSNLTDAGEESKSASSRQQTSPQDYKAATKQLQDFLDELSSSRKASGGLSDLQFKIDRLNKATSSLQPAVVPDEEASSPQDENVETKEPVIEAISALLLEYLTQDLKNRPGSYIGTKFDDIVAASRMRRGVVDLALQDLSSKGLIHNTIDDKTWVISDPPEGLSVLPTNATSVVPTTTATSSKPSKRTLSRTALWILSNIPYNVWSSTEAGVHRHISLKSQLSLTEIERALWEISQRTEWYPNTTEVKTFAETLVAGNPIETLNSWTYINKNIVDPRILRASNVQFQEFEDSIVIHRTLKTGELLDWAERSTEIRQSQGTDVEAVTESKSAHPSRVEEQPRSQASQSKRDPQLSLFVLEKDSADNSWENVWPKKQRLPFEDLLQCFALMRKNTGSVKDALDEIKSPIIQRLIRKLVDDETQKLWDIDRTVQWKLAAIDIDWEAGHDIREVKRVSVMLEIQPSVFVSWNPAATFGAQSTEDDTQTRDPLMDETPAEPVPAIEEQAIEPKPAQSTQDEGPLSTLASTIHGFLVLNHEQSYEINDLATGFGFSHVAMAAAISELSGRHMVHEVGNNKWAVTLPGHDEAATKEAASKEGEVPSSADLGPAASKIMHHMHHSALESYSATSLSDTLDLTQEAVHLALIELSTQNLVRHATGDFWALTDSETTSKTNPNPSSLTTPLDLPPHIRDAKTFTNTPPSPTAAASEAAPHRVDVAHLTPDDFAAYVSPSGARWTRLDKVAIDPRVLRDEGEAFDDADDGLVLHRVVRRGEVERWAERSREMRGGRRADRKGKGRERDDAQGRLDRVLAGDMREGELRYFAGDGDGDGDGERYS